MQSILRFVARIVEVVGIAVHVGIAHVDQSSREKLDKPRSHGAVPVQRIDVVLNPSVGKALGTIIALSVEMVFVAIL